MIHSIKDFSDKQIEDLRQCPGVIITLDECEAEVPMMAEGLFLSISKSVPNVPTIENESNQNPDESLRLKYKKRPYKIYSRILDDYLWIVANDKELQELVDEGIKETIYTQEEVSRMIDEGVSKEGLKAIHKVKKSFTGAMVEDIENEQKEI